jgi:hypothetical protein
MTYNRKRPDRAEFCAMCETMTAHDIREATGASLGSISRWGDEYGCKPITGAWGGSRPRGCKSVPQPYEVSVLPLPATPGPLSYWQQMGQWMMEDAA